MVTTNIINNVSRIFRLDVGTDPTVCFSFHYLKLIGLDYICKVIKTKLFNERTSSMTQTVKSKDLIGLPSSSFDGIYVDLLEDESHFLFKCEKYSNYRGYLLGYPHKHYGG